MRFNHEGREFELPEGTTPEDAMRMIQSAPPRKELFSMSGIASAFRTIAPSIVQGYEGNRLRDYEAMIQAFEKNPEQAKTFGISEENYKEAKAGLERSQGVLREIQTDMEAEAAGQSRPLSWFRSAITSTAQNLPGLAAAIATRDLGKIAAVAPLAQAEKMTSGQVYAEGRTPDAEGKTKGSIEDSRINADVQGAVEAAFELAPVSFFIDRVGKEGIGKFLAGYFGRELATELPTTAAQNISDWATVERDMPMKEFLSKLGTDLVDTAASTIMGAGMSGPTGMALARLGKIGRGQAEEGDKNQEIMPPSGPADLKVELNPPPPAAQPTVIPPSDEQERLKELIRSVDPTKLTDEDIARDREFLAKLEAAKKAPPSEEAKVKWGPTLDFAPDPDVGATAGQALNQVNYANPNDTIPRWHRIFLWSTDEEAIGKTPSQHAPKPGVYILGSPTSDRPEAMLRASAESLEQWRQKYLPNASLIVSNEGLKLPTALGEHFSQSPGVHVIVPGVLRNAKSLDEFNSNTQVGIFYTLTHEFGHAVLDDRFFGEIDPILGQRIREESKAGVISEEAIAQLDEVRGAVAREYNSAKSRIMDGTMTAQELVDHWIGPAKAGRKFLKSLKVAPQDNAMAVLKALERDAVGVAKGLGQAKGFKAIKEAYRSKYFSFDEYMAEQMARHAYHRKWDQNTPLGKFFQGALESLRKFFVDLKREKYIKPGVAFQEWLDGLSKLETATERVTKAKGAAKKVNAVKAKTPAAKEAASKPRPKREHKKVERVEHNVATSTDEEKAKYGRSLITGLVKSGAIESTDPSFKEMLNMLRDKDWGGFIDRFQQLSGKSVKFSLDVADAEMFRQQPALDKKMQKLAERMELERDADLEQEPIDETDIQQKLITNYWEYLEAQQGRGPFTSPEMAVGNMQANIRQAGGGEVTAEAALAAAKDAYDAYNRVVQKLKGIDFEVDDNLDFTQPNKHAAAAPLSEADARNPSTLADAAREWLQNGYLSKYFKAWFGDWINEPERSSQVVTFSGQPMGLFHATRENFTTFDMGDVGFHFGTLRAAHNRHYDAVFANTPGSLAGSYKRYERLGKELANPKDINRAWADAQMSLVSDVRFIPVVLNIRNPLNFGEEYTKMWKNPYELVTALRREGYISDEKAAELEAAVDAQVANAKGAQVTQLRYLTAPVRKHLQALGYDGIKYKNTVEGDTSWVAFEPEQVKSLLGTKTFSKSKDMNYELDFDLSTAQGETGDKLTKSLRPWLNLPGPIRRSLRWAQGVATQVLEIQQLAHLNPWVTPLAMFSRMNTGYNILKSKMMAAADAVIGEWSSPKLSKDNYDKIGKALVQERDGGKLWWGLEQVNGEWRYVMTETAMNELKARGIDIATPEGEQLAAQILAAKNALIIQLNGWEAALENAAMHRYAASGTDALMAAIRPIRRMIHKIREYPFFPQGRFGNYILTIEKKAERGYTVAHREAFESIAEWEKAVAAAERNKKPDERVRKHELRDQEVALLALPYDFIDLAASELDLSDEPGVDGEPSQVERLMQILQPTRPEKALKAYDLDRLKLTGGDKDPMRSFAAFTWHNANLIAKTQFRAAFNSTIREVHSMLRLAQYSDEPGALDKAYKLQRIEKAMKDARDYIMHPANELQALRTFVSIAYLALNIKTALMNFFGLVTTASDLVSRFGPIEGGKRFTKATAQALGTIKLTDLNDARKVDYLDPDTQAALDRALEEGVLSQSYAYHLAGVANSGTLWRMPAANQLARITHGGVDAAMWLFRLTELSTRRATFLAQYEAEKAKPTEDLVPAYDQAVHRTNLLQNDYSLGNRVPFMRGGFANLGPLSPIATIFMSFTQHMAFHSYGGYELGERRRVAMKGETPRTAFGGYTMKIWIVTLLLAGYEGLPGAENLLDLLQALWRKWGGDKPIRQHLREMVQALEVPLLTPGLAAHGLGHNVPVPTPFGVAQVDISRSIGLGRMVPGTDVLAHPRDVPSEQFGTLVLDLLGPFGGFLKFGAEAFISDKPFAQTLERLPGGIGNIYSAYRWIDNGVRAPTGAQITIDPVTGKPRDLTAAEIASKAAGFNPTIVSENREMRFAQYDRKVYWQTRRDMLLDDVWRARLEKDQAAIADSRQAIRDFNTSVPDQFRSIRISGEDIQRSMRSRDRRRKLDEAGQPSERRYRSIYEDVESSFR